MCGLRHSMLRRRVSTGHKGDGGCSLFSRFLAATATHRYAFRLTSSRRRPFQARKIRWRHFVCRADNERCTMTRRPAVSRELRLCPRVAIVQVDARRSGTVDLPLHGGRVPAWLANRMAKLGAVICQAIVHSSPSVREFLDCARLLVLQRSRALAGPSRVYVAVLFY